MLRESRSVKRIDRYECRRECGIAVCLLKNGARDFFGHSPREFLDDELFVVAQTAEQTSCAQKLCGRHESRISLQTLGRATHRASAAFSNVVSGRSDGSRCGVRPTNVKPENMSPMPTSCPR
jgi:hypothetical protein